MKPGSTHIRGANMKFTRWAVGIWSAAALLMVAGNADAWLCCHHGCGGCCRHHCFETHICCRPYNAFTPICWGNLYCDGCCPNPQGVASGCCIPGSWSGCLPGIDCAASPWGYPPPSLAGGGPYPRYPIYGDMNQINPYQGTVPGGMLPGGMLPGGPVPSMPTSMPLPQGATPAAPAVPPVLNHTAQYPYGMYYGLQPAGYYPYGYYPMGYAPGYNPYYYGQQR